MPKYQIDEIVYGFDDDWSNPGVVQGKICGIKFNCRVTPPQVVGYRFYSHPKLLITENCMSKSLEEITKLYQEHVNNR